MTTIVTAQGDTIPSTNLGGFIFDLANWGIAQQKNTAKNPNQLDFLSVAIDTEPKYEAFPQANGGRAIINFSPQARIDYLSRDIAIPDYLINSGFTSATGNTFSGIWTEQLFSAILLLQELQKQPSKNPLALELVSISAAMNNSGLPNINWQISCEVPLRLLVTSTGLHLEGLDPMGEI